MRRALLALAFAGTAGGLLAGVIEAALVYGSARALFVTSRELHTALRVIAVVNAAGGALCGALLVPIGGLIGLLGRALGKGARGRARALGLVLLPAFGATLWALSAGARARAIPGRPALVGVLALAAAAGVAWSAPRILGALTAEHRGRRLVFACVLALAGVGLGVADGRVLVRLYPVLHAWLGALELLALMGAVGLLLPGRDPGRARSLAVAGAALALILPLAALAGACASVIYVLSTQNTRSILAERAPGTARVLAALSRVGVRAPTATEQMALDTEMAPAPPVDLGSLPDLATGDRDLLLVTIDALRADHLGAYGYARPTSPAIDALARESVVFERAYSVTPQTSYAVTSLLTGKYVRSLYRLGQAPSSETLAHMLRARGMHTAGFFTDAVFFIDRERFAPFEQDRFGLEYSKMHPLDARPRFEQVREYVRGRSASDRLFVWVHLFEPHEPYEPHPAHRFGDRDVDLYDGEIATADDVVGDLVRLMRTRGDPMVVVTADHGEEFGDHGGRYHGTTLYEEQIRVPLIMHVPGVDPRRVDAPVQLVDVVPTVLGLYAVPYGARVRGTDLRPLLLGRPAATRAFAEALGARMVVEGNEKLVCNDEHDLCRLYDLKADPREQHNLADARPERVRTLERALSVWARGHARFERQPIAASSAAADWPEAIRRALLGDTEAATDTAALLRSDEPRLRAKAAEVLGVLGRAEVVPALAAALDDRDRDVVAQAAVSLLELGDARGVPIARALLDDPTRAAPLRWRAALAIAGRGDSAAAPRLRELVRTGGLQSSPETQAPIAPVEVRNLAIARLGNLRDRASVPILIERLGEVREKSAAVLALGEIGDRRAVRALCAVVVDDPYQNVRSAAAAALVRLGDRSARTALRRSLGTREPAAGALEALVRLGGEAPLSERAPTGWTCSAEGCTPPAAGAHLPLPRGHRRVVFWLSAQGDGGRLLVNDTGLPIVTGSHEEYVNLPAPSGEVFLRTDPPDLAVSIRAIATTPLP